MQDSVAMGVNNPDCSALSTAETQPKLHPALRRLSAIISPNVHSGSEFIAV
jgi:hypothetical protein